MKTSSCKISIVALPLVFIFTITILISLYYVNALENYHNENVENFIEEYHARQYSKIKADVDSIVNFLDYAMKTKRSLAVTEQKALDRIYNIDKTTAPYMFILKLLKPAGGKDFAKIIFYNNRANAVNKLVSGDKVDQDKKLFLQEMLKDIQKQGFSYTIYKHAKPNNKNINKKLTLFYLYEPLQWIITSSVFLDEVNEEIEKKELELNAQVHRTIIVSISLLFAFSLLVLAVFYRISSKVYKKIEDNELQLLETNKELQQALTEVKQLSGILPICSFCKKIRSDDGYWLQVEQYIEKHSEAVFSHGLCRECMDEHYGNFTNKSKKDVDKDG